MSKDTAPAAPATPAAPALIPMVIFHGGQIRDVAPSERDRLVEAGEGREATAQDLAIAGRKA